MESTINTDISIYLDKYKMCLNPDSDIVDAIKKRTLKCGGHCPCEPKDKRNEDTICPCLKMRSEGICKCTLYVSK